MSSRDRYISPEDMGARLAELRVTETSGQDSLLEFLEEQRIVTPVLRVRWPQALVIEGRGETPEVAATPEERAGAEALDGSLRRWRRYDAGSALEHPFDEAAGDAAALLTFDVATTPFQSWKEFLIKVRSDGESPLLVSGGIDTYYHRWQALLIADAVDMGVNILVDTRRPDLMAAVWEGRFGDIPEEARRVQINLRAPRGLTQGQEWSRFFDAAARLQVRRARHLETLSRGYSGQPVSLGETEQAALVRSQADEAKRQLAMLGTDRSGVVRFIKYLCERWDEWLRRDRSELADAYKEQLANALRLLMSAFDIDFTVAAQEVGRVTGHFAQTLDVIFPDWSVEARRKLEGSLKFAVIDAQSAGAPLGLIEADVPELGSWLESINQWKVHHHVKAIIEHQFKGSAVDHSALAKEVEGLGLTLEHIVSALLDVAGKSTGGTLLPKLQRLWQGRPNIVALLEQHKALTRTYSVSRAAQLAAINALPGTGDVDVVKVLLRAVLYRNDGTHNAMASWSESELHACTADFLAALMLCRKVLLTDPPP